MSKNGGITFDFGDLDGEDVKRVAQEMDERKYEHFTPDEVAMRELPQVAGMFVRFVRDVLTNMGLIDKAGIANPRIGIAVDLDPKEFPEESMKALWNERARDWAVVESPATYAVTFQTLIEQFHLKGSGQKETIVSLGSGPGLYETFLGHAIGLTDAARDVRIVCVDSATGMTECHRQILKDANLKVPGTETVVRVENVEAVTGDMLNLQFEDGSVDQIICNNALQWALDWRKAIAEMARIMNPKEAGFLYLFVHRHPMAVCGEDGTPLRLFGVFSIDELLDCLEENRFEIIHTRQIVGRKGMGQLGSSIDRVFVRARFSADGLMHKWRDAKIKASLSGMR